jgi:hypothetical protein
MQNQKQPPLNCPGQSEPASQYVVDSSVAPLSPRRPRADVGGIREVGSKPPPSSLTH